MKIKPLHNWILIEPQEAKTKTETGLILATEKDKKTELAIVKALGNEMRTSIKEGDKVLFKSYTVDEVVIEKDIYHFIKEEDLIALV